MADSLIKTSKDLLEQLDKKIAELKIAIIKADEILTAINETDLMDRKTQKEQIERLNVRIKSLSEGRDWTDLLVEKLENKPDLKEDEIEYINNGLSETSEKIKNLKTPINVKQ